MLGFGGVLRLQILSRVLGLGFADALSGGKGIGQLVEVVEPPARIGDHDFLIGGLDWLVPFGCTRSDGERVDQLVDVVEPPPGDA